MSLAHVIIRTMARKLRWYEAPDILDYQRRLFHIFQNFSNSRMTWFAFFDTLWRPTPDDYEEQTMSTKELWLVKAIRHTRVAAATSQ